MSDKPRLKDFSSRSIYFHQLSLWQEQRIRELENLNEAVGEYIEAMKLPLDLSDNNSGALLKAERKRRLVRLSTAWAALQNSDSPTGD